MGYIHDIAPQMDGSGIKDDALEGFPALAESVSVWPFGRLCDPLQGPLNQQIRIELDHHELDIHGQPGEIWSARCSPWSTGDGWFMMLVHDGCLMIVICSRWLVNASRWYIYI